MGLWSRLSAWLGRGATDLPPPGGPDPAILFRDRYHSFRLLLAANGKALDLMAELEEAAQGRGALGSSFVRSRCTALGVAVYQMVKHLDALAPARGRYVGLYSRLQAIQHQINGVLDGPRALPAEASLVLPLEGVGRESSDLAGGKMANLGELVRLGLPTPDGFVVTSAGYLRFMAQATLRDEIRRLIQSWAAESTDQVFGLSSQIQQLIVAAPVPDDLAAAVEEAYQDLCARVGREGVRVALRSSALGEDAAGASFAGQYRSQLNVSPENLLEAYKDVVASKYTPQAMQYRLNRGLRDEEIAMAVGCLAMVEARSAGVAYSVSPTDPGDRDLQISAAWGLGKAVVDGDAETDTLVLARGPQGPRLKETRVGHQESKFVCYPEEGVCRLTLTGDEADLPALSEAEALELGRLVLKLEEHFGAPQDVEWALDQSGRLLILQARPLQVPEASTGEAAGPRPVPEGIEALVRGGVAASPGSGSGPVFWVGKDAEAMRFPSGAVLAVDSPLPRWAALLGRAAAVVARHGSQAGHLATVAREYGVPALLALGDAAARLEQGALVTVDAEGRAVYPGRVEALLAQGAQARPDLGARSPVRAMLQEALALIAPLNLLDPDAPTFTPAHCQTLHDITRFCHEKSVKEMFDFGQEQPFPEHSSKQLHYKVPMQFWILNLEDGFREEVSGKYVRLEQIACRPMLAVWEGMVAVPWAGPPAVSGRGMASVLFQATANPALGSPYSQRYANRNYFLISRDFLNLQSRFGFHFAQVEAMAGERPGENYISFSFKGGAADQERKVQRVRFIAAILEGQGYRVELKGDTAMARLEGLPDGEILRQLKVVGYLIMHTRQLDMIMGHPATVSAYRRKIDADIAGILDREAEEGGGAG